MRSVRSTTELQPRHDLAQHNIHGFYVRLPVYVLAMASFKATPGKQLIHMIIFTLELKLF